MKRPAITHLKVYSLLILFLSVSCSEPLGGYRQAFNLGKIARENKGICRITDGHGFKGQTLMIRPTSENSSVTIWKTGENDK